MIGEPMRVGGGPMQVGELDSPRFGWIWMVPYFLLLYCRIDFFGAQLAGEGGADDGALKMAIEAFSYAIAGLLILARLDEVKPLFAAMLPFILYTIYAGFTAAWSDYPESVLLRVGHMIGLGLVAIAAGAWSMQKRSSIFYFTAAFMLAVLIMSVLCVVFLPQRGLVTDLTGVQFEGARWIGITGHPNLLGAVAMAGIWTAIAIQYFNKQWWVRVMAWSTIGLAIVALIGSDSRTSMFSSAFLVVVLLLLHARNPVGPGEFFKRVAVLSAVLGVVIGAVYIVSPDFVSSHMSFGTRAGASNSLSDRNLIWAYGIEAFKDHPMGWSYDLLQTYWDSHGKLALFPHFHDGYLDVAVKGGVVAEMLLFWILVRIGWSIGRLYHRDYQLFALHAAFFASLLVYNLAETGFDREALLWPFMIVAWVSVEALNIRLEGETSMVAPDFRPRPDIS